MTPELLDPVLRLLRLSEKPEDSAVLAPCCSGRSFTACGVASKANNLSEWHNLMAMPAAFVKAVIWLKENFDKPFSIKLIAEQTNMSPSGLHHHFKTLTNMTPLQYQKHLRLQEARRLMLAHGMDASAAAYHVGYASRSQFSREYSRLFGAPPRRDVEQIR